VVLSRGQQAGRHFLQTRFGAEGLYVASSAPAGLTTRVVTLQVLPVTGIGPDEVEEVGDTTLATCSNRTDRTAISRLS